MPDPRYRVLAIGTHPVQYMTQLLRRMAAHPSLDLQVAYCSMRGAESGHDPEFGAAIKWDVPLLDGYAWSHVPNRGSGKESFFGLFNPGLWKLIRSGNFDAVLCFTSYVRATFWVSYFASRSCRAAFLFGCDQGSLEPRDGRQWKRTLKKIAWPILYGLADQVVVSSTRARQLIHSLGIPDERITLTPLVVDNDWWEARTAEVNRQAVRQSWGATEEHAVILFCAKFQAWKRPFDLLHAFAQANIPQSLLVFAGEGPLRPQLEEAVGKLGLASRVRFLGFVNQSQLPAVYASADLMVLPSEFEPFGVVVSEAMCCGCPVAASDCVGAAPDLIVPVAPQFIFSPGDVGALAGILSDAFADRARLRALSQAVRAHLRTWSPDRNVAATVDAIRMAVGRLHPQSSEEKTSSLPVPEKSAAQPQRPR